MAKKNKRAKSIWHLIDIIGAGVDGYGDGVVHVQIWDGRVVTSKFSKSPTEDVSTIEVVVMEVKKLLPFVERLLDTGQPLVVKTGNGDQVMVARGEKLF